jgi:membrane protein required for colicin V production
MTGIPVIDLIFMILIALMAIRVYFRGFIKEVFSWAAIILAIWVAVMLHGAGADFIRSRIMQNVAHIPEILSFVAIFAIGMLLLKMLEHVLKDVIMGAKLGGVDRFLGAIFGLVEGLALTAIIIFVLSIQPLFDASKILAESNFAQILLPVISTPLDIELTWIDLTINLTWIEGFRV